jgi:predicted nucleotidyltransferase
MSKKLDISETHCSILALFTRGYHNEYYIREIASLLPVSHGTVQTILCDLEEKQVLSSTLKGRIRIFRLKKTLLAAEYLGIAEVYKRIAFLEENPLIAELMEKIDPFLSGCAGIFGSYAKGTATKGSDLDLFVAGDCDRHAIDKTAAKYGVEVNTVVLPKDAFAPVRLQDNLIQEILKDHVIWKETEFFVRTVMAA